VIGTLAKDGLRVSDREVEKRLEEHATPLAAEGGDADDQKLAARTELAETMIRRSLARADHTVTNAQVAAYYRTHRSRFLVREKRYIDIENLKTRAQALQIRHEVELGESAPFTRGVLHEVIERLPSVKYDRGEDGIRSAILQARLNTITGPLPNGEYGLFEVKRIVAAHYEPLAQVRGTIEQQLAGEQRRLALSRFLAAWRKHWRAVTDCHPGYVVQRCRQYKGPLAPEEPPAFK